MMATFATILVYLLQNFQRAAGKLFGISVSTLIKQGHSKITEIGCCGWTVCISFPFKIGKALSIDRLGLLQAPHHCEHVSIRGYAMGIFRRELCRLPEMIQSRGVIDAIFRQTPTLQVGHRRLLFPSLGRLIKEPFGLYRVAASQSLLSLLDLARRGPHRNFW